LNQHRRAPATPNFFNTIAPKRQDGRETAMTAFGSKTEEPSLCAAKIAAIMPTLAIRIATAAKSDEKGGASGK